MRRDRHSLLLVRAQKTRPGGPWSDDDYDVLDKNRKVVGRISRAPIAPADRPWSWAIIGGFPNHPGPRGRSRTREEAISEFKRAWQNERSSTKRNYYVGKRRRRNLPWLYRRTQFLGLTPYRLFKWGIPLGLLLVVSVSHQLKSINYVAPATISKEITAIDGDTVRSGGYTYRLVGFDTPEKGTLARCEAERDLAEQATSRLEQLLRSDRVELQRVRCSCRQGTENTPECNYGRRCAILKVDAQDVGPILIREGLAHSYICGDIHCPRRQSWCG